MRSPIRIHYIEEFATAISSPLAEESLAEAMGHGKRDGSGEEAPIMLRYRPNQSFSSSP